MDLQKILYVAVVAVVLVSYIDCQTIGRPCRRPVLVQRGQTCAFDRTCYPGACCLNNQGKSYCIRDYQTTTDKPKRRVTTKSPLKKTFQNATNVIAINLIRKFQEFVPGAIDAMFNRHKTTDKTIDRTVVTMAPGRESLGDRKTEKPQTIMIPTNSQHLVAPNTAAGVVEGTKLMLNIISTSVILLYI